MKINRRTIKYVLKHTDSTIGDLIKWFKRWKVRKHGICPMQKHLYLGRFFFCGIQCDAKNHVYVSTIADGLERDNFAVKYVINKQFRTEFLAELEKMRGEFE